MRAGEFIMHLSISLYNKYLIIILSFKKKKNHYFIFRFTQFNEEKVKIKAINRKCTELLHANIMPSFTNITITIFEKK